PVLEGLGVASSRQRLVLNYNYKAFLGDLKPGDIASRLNRTIEYVVPYEHRVLTSMNTGSPRILHSRRWERFGRVVNQMIRDLDVFSADGAADAATAQASERIAKTGIRREIL